MGPWGANLDVSEMQYKPETTSRFAGFCHLHSLISLVCDMRHKTPEGHEELEAAEGQPGRQPLEL